MKSVLLVAKTGQVRDGLQALSTAIPSVGTVTVCESLEVALEYVSEHCPELVIFVGDDHFRDSESLGGFRDICRGMTSLILLLDEGDCQTVAGVNWDRVVHVGSSASRLADTIQAFLLDDGQF